jgi:hypothetical protein
VAIEERWQLINEDVTLYAPEISRHSTPDEFLDEEEQHHAIITFENVLVGCKTFSESASRDEWVANNRRGKRVELINPATGIRKAGNVIEIRIGDPPDDRLAAVMIYIERILPPEDVEDWVI